MSKRAEREREFDEFARVRAAALHRSAWLLCRDEHEAQDLVQEALTKVYLMWMRPLARIDNPVAYAHATLTRTFLSARRKKSSGEVPVEEFPERAHDDETERTTTRLVADAALARLSPLDRAIVVARYVDDVSVADTAALVGLSPGAVRTRAMRALEKLRGWLEPPAPLAVPAAPDTEEVHA